MSAFHVTLYAASLPKLGLPAMARFVGAVLRFDAAGVSESVPVGALTVTVGGFDDTQLFLNWQTASGERRAAMPTDAAARQALLQGAPEPLQMLLRRGQGQATRQSFKWNAVLGSLAVLALLLGLFVWQSDRLTGWLAERVPLASEQRLGKAMLKQLQGETTLKSTGPAAEMVKEIGSKLTKGSRYEYQWFVRDDASINAFAVPGGIVVVHSGLIAKASSPEEIAGVLAHEVQHVELRHSLNQMIHTAGWAAILAVTLGDVSAITGVLIHQAGNLHHSRKLETEADIQGLKALARAGIPLQGMAKFFAKLAEEKKDDAEIALLSSHPATAERLKAIEKLAAATPCPSCKPLVFDWRAVQADVADSDEKPAAECKPKGKTKDASECSRSP